MNYFLSIIMIVLILIVESWSGIKNDFSSWQLRKKELAKDSKKAKLDLDRLKYRASVVTLQVFILVLLYIGLYNLAGKLGIKSLDRFLLLTIWFMASNMIAKTKFISAKVNDWYKIIEPKLYSFFGAFSRLNSYLSLTSLSNLAIFTQRDSIDSIDELNFLIENSPHVINDSQAKAIASSLGFFDKKVKDVMVEIDEVFSVEPGDVLGPLRIDELHKTGHSHFPVMTENNHILGMIDIHQLANLEVRDTLKARDMMRKEMLKLNNNDLLETALSEMIQSKNFIAIVENSHLQPVGIISIKDIIPELLGR